MQKHRSMVCLIFECALSFSFSIKNPFKPFIPVACEKPIPGKEAITLPFVFSAPFMSRTFSVVFVILSIYFHNKLL